MASGSRDVVVASLARYALSVGGAEITGRVRGEVSRRLVDSIACAYGALDSAPVLALRAAAEERATSSGCTLWGSAYRATPELAALANGAAIRFLDYNDYTAGGHPSDTIAALVAACEWSDATVDELIAGIVVSYEVWGALGPLYLRYRGWDQGTTASIAAVCGIGRILGLDEDQLANAIGIVATSDISLFKVRRGQLSSWKGIAVPYSAQSALLVASLAAKGVTGPQDAFAGEFGFWQQISGEFEIEGLQPGSEASTIFDAGFKHWPVEYEAQFAVWLAQRIRAEVAVDEIRSLSVYTAEWTWNVIANDPSKWAPTTRETADHSLPYILAVSLVRGRIDHEDFDPTVLSKVAYVELMARISVHPDEEISVKSHERAALRATVQTLGGDKLHFEIDEPRARPVTDVELEDKWGRLTEGSRLADGSDGLLADLKRLEGRQRVRDLMAPLTDG